MRSIFLVDAFTDKPFGGNPAGVVIYADGLNAIDMQNIAREINASETAFVYKKQNNTYKIRFFTPTQEIDFCGHATIASAWILGSEYKSESTEMFETNIGMVPIELDIKDKIIERVTMTQIPPKVKDFNEIQNILEIIGIEDNYDSKYPIKLAYTGNWHLLIPIISKEAIDNAKPNFEALKNHNTKYDISTTHLFTFDTEGDELVYTRDFAPAAGVNEDPITGSANGALAGYFVLENILPPVFKYTIVQGNSFGRYGQLFISTTIDNDVIKIKLGGKAVCVLKGFLNNIE